VTGLAGLPGLDGEGRHGVSRRRGENGGGQGRRGGGAQMDAGRDSRPKMMM
jgi:hypothetical protein